MIEKFSKMTVAEKIRAVRIKRGYTQKMLGQMTGINEANIRKYELNKQNPKYETLEKIAIALDVSVFFFITSGTSIETIDYWDQKVCEFLETPDEPLQQHKNHDASTKHYELALEVSSNPEKLTEITQATKNKKAKILEKIDLLNEVGQEKALEQVELLTKIPEYQKKD